MAWTAGLLLLEARQRCGAQRALAASERMGGWTRPDALRLHPARAVYYIAMHLAAVASPELGMEQWRAVKKGGLPLPHTLHSPLNTAQPAAIACP